MGKIIIILPKFKMSYQSKRIHGCQSASSIDPRVKISHISQTLRIRGALPTAQQRGVVMEPERACGSSAGDGFTLCSTSQQPPLLQLRGAARTVECASATYVSEDNFGGPQCVLISVFREKGDFFFCLRQASAHLISCLGDGAADLQVAEGGATDGRRRPDCLVIYSDYFINI